jgi:hypothetical protein
MSREKILLVGVGELGGIVLEFLCRVPGICEIVAADSNADWGCRKANSAIEGASYMGLFPKIQFHQLDLLDVDRTAELLAAIKPTLIYNGTTLQSWWVVNELPPDKNALLYGPRCGLGPWSAMHLALTYRLMQAVDRAGIRPYVVNSSFPDVTNPSLARIGLAPTVGIGNIDLAVPYIQKAAAEILDVPMSNVRVELIGHHYHAYYWCRTGTAADVRHHLRVFVGVEDVTAKLGDRAAFIAQLPRRGMRPAGRHGQFVVAASSVRNIMAILNDTGEIGHAPGPEGLEGGYPVRLSRQGANVVLPAGMTRQEARAINLEAQQYDGIQEVAANGDIVFTDEAHIRFKEVLGVDSKRVTLADSYEQALELRHKFRAFLNDAGVVL